MRGCQTAHVSVFRNTGELIVLGPCATTIGGDLNQAIVSSDIEQVFLLGRFGQRNDVSVERRRLILCDRVRSPYFAHDRKLVAVELASKVAADGFPCIAAVVTAEKPIGSKVYAGM